MFMHLQAVPNERDHDWLYRLEQVRTSVCVLGVCVVWCAVAHDVLLLRRV